MAEPAVFPMQVWGKQVFLQKDGALGENVTYHKDHQKLQLQELPQTRSELKQNQPLMK